MTNGSSTDALTKTIGQYLLRYLVAEGSIASVYIAQLPEAHGSFNWVAIKVMHPHLARSERFVQMFLNEGKIVAGIHHPNICSVTDFGVDEERHLPYLVMEYLHGETFSNVIQRSFKNDFLPPIHSMAQIVSDAARGLHAAHELKTKNGELLGVIHHDISPRNIIVLYDGLAKVIDFGGARLRRESNSTKSSELKTRLSYMSPEQFKDEELDRRADVWALGVVLWEATVGRSLFGGEKQSKLVYNVIDGDIPRPSEVAREYPRELDRIVMKALERDRDKRYQTAEELAGDLYQFLHPRYDPIGPRQITTWMEELFADHLAVRDSMLKSEDLPVDIVPEVDLGTEGTEELSLHDRAIEVSDDDGRRFPTQKALIGLAAVVVLALVAFAVFFGPWSGGSEGQAVAENTAGAPQDAPPPQDDTLPREPEGLPEKGADVVPDLGSVSPSADAGEDAAAPAPAGDAGSDDGGTAEVVTRTDISTPPHEVVSPIRRETKVATGPMTRPPPREPSKATTQRAPPREPSTTPQRRPPPREPSTPPARGGSTGSLNLMAFPAAEVRAGGRRLGTTPLFNVSLPPGRHRLSLTPVGGGPTKSITVTVKAGETVRRTVRFNED